MCVCVCVLTSVACVNDEAAVVEGGSLDQTFAVSSDLAGVAHVRLDDRDGDWTVGDVLPVLQDADLMLADLAGDEGEAWEERTGQAGGGEQEPGLSALPV